ncbi:MAG: hypothetical protein JRJ66_02950 [Deltaproteobacteria bacterium]|nr:hypothetical protein [Deltaproteobacteria bacterium]MBW2046304.1 hypothetical protein [Deltaproteobacteria bacterium]
MAKQALQNIILSMGKDIFQGGNIDLILLTRRKLFKTLSLAEASKEGLPILPTYVPLEYNETALSKILEVWKYPVIIRVDYTKLPRTKLLGGFPIRKPDIAKELAKFLFKEHYYPLFHPFVDRLRNIYSVGILINTDIDDLDIEILGKGFDASDLRLGHSVPHENLKLHRCGSSRAKRISLISQSAYDKERERRKKKVNKMLKYIDFINEKGRLLSSLENFQDDVQNETEISEIIPKEYNPMPKNLLNPLIEIVDIIQSNVIPKLPSSKTFIASLSYVNKKGWILWDVYGAWYYR